MGKMLYLYQSNRLETIAQFFAKTAAAVPLSTPFQPEVVVVQSRGMARWLSLQFATHTGIAANMDFVLPAAYAWRLMRCVRADLPQTSSFSPEVLVWQLMALLPTLSDPIFALLTRYQEQGEFARFELAGKIADIFDQYLVFRPDWIRRWERKELLGLGNDEVWQAALWRQLVGSGLARHRVQRLDDLLRTLSSQHLPERVTFFGITSLAPVYLTFIKRIAELTDVCLFLLNPCGEYWGALGNVDAMLEPSCLPDDGHPLLASLGKQGRDFFEQIGEGSPDVHSLFVPPVGQSLLARLQRDILTLTFPGTTKAWPDSLDYSIEIHSVPSPMRELEVLKDALLGYLQSDETLTPADIAILTPDIDTYAPYIDAVFGTATDISTRLPYSIADRQLEREEPLLATFSAVLDLMDSRFVADQVMVLLDCPAVLARFTLCPADLGLLRQWVRRSGIRWGIDAAHKERLGLPKDPLYTWRWGLDRLLLGGVLPEALAQGKSPLFADLLPAPGAEGQFSELLAGFCQFFQVLQSFAAQWRHPATAATWRARLLALIQGLFVLTPPEETVFDVVYKALEELVNNTQAVGFQEEISGVVVRAWLKQQLSVASPSKFLAGGLTFCAMVPMRALPFRILCLIGMNDGVYPRVQRPVSFDLIARYPRRGDRSRRLDDRYLFLEAILAARDKLYLSYIGLSIRSGESVPPSALLAQLLDVLASMSGANSVPQRVRLEQQLIVKHPLQPFSTRYFDGRDPRLASFATHYARALSQPAAKLPPFSSVIRPPAAINTVHFDDFIRFWQLPCRAWLTDRLGIRIKKVAEELAIREPFALARNTRQVVRQQLVDGLLEKQPLAPIYERLLAGGDLPGACLGQACLQQEISASRRLIESLPTTLQEQPYVSVPFKLPLNGLVLVGQLTVLKPGGHVRVLPRPAYAADIITMWLNHLVACATMPDRARSEAVLFAEDEPYHWGPVPDACLLLTHWGAYWLLGQQQPLPFFPRTSWAYARTFYTSQNMALSRRKALTEWDPTFAGRVAQKDDPAIELAFRSQSPLEDPMFHEMVMSLLAPLCRSLLPEAL